MDALGEDLKARIVRELGGQDVEAVCSSVLRLGLCLDCALVEWGNYLRRDRSLERIPFGAGAMDRHTGEVKTVVVGLPLPAARLAVELQEHMVRLQQRLLERIAPYFGGKVTTWEALEQYRADASAEDYRAAVELMNEAQALDDLLWSGFLFFEQPATEVTQ